MGADTRIAQSDFYRVLHGGGDEYGLSYFNIYRILENRAMVVKNPEVRSKE